MGKQVVHVVGAGLAGLAAAVRLMENGAEVRLYEAAAQAGGRCRSFFDPILGMRIDNGNHLVLSGNRSTLAYLSAIGAAERLKGPADATFDFVDMASTERWRLRLNDGAIPWWIFNRRRRVPHTRAQDYLRAAALLWAPDDRPVGRAMACSGPLYERLWKPILQAALNTDPAESSCGLAASVLRETLVKGGRACRPLIARDGLSEAFVDPALRVLEKGGATIRYGRRLRSISFATRNVEELNFGDEVVRVSADDSVILAVPPWVATTLVPDLPAPSEFRSIVNAHFKVFPPAQLAPVIGVANGTIEWIFSFRDRLAITISAADRLLDVARETLAAALWRELAAATGLNGAIPPWQIIKERRATFAALPAENAKRPASLTRWINLVLAGDWVRTGLPATIEGAIRSGHHAAQHCRERV
jgi:squalene-associated FAD-dependent desaturase